MLYTGELSNVLSVACYGNLHFTWWEPASRHQGNPVVSLKSLGRPVRSGPSWPGKTGFGPGRTEFRAKLAREDQDEVHESGLLMAPKVVALDFRKVPRNHLAPCQADQTGL